MKKRFYRFRRIKLSKRKEIVIATVLLTTGFILTQLVDPGMHFLVLAFITVCAGFGSILILREQLTRVKVLTLVVLPVFFTISWGLFYFLLPVRWLTRLPMALVYGIGIYALFLVTNIYNVAATRSIQLLRVAHAIGFLATLIVVFGFTNTIYSFHFMASVNAGIVFLLFLPLFIHTFWAVLLSDAISGRIILYSIVSSLMTAEVAFILSFWPLTPILAGLFITTVVYTLIGINQQYFAGRLFRKNIIEFIRVFVIVFILILITTRYR